ncbi:hypothetical protein UFOVP628_40 [uncultured Caudovirales phage]|uniref:Uncharacterized protein n=1 Tax=uncultured Caudovirales phage TaxID=2100421 RepID=A0A6J5N7G1_9CAUD|nr:hypothetical protein UFOVP628_40 [uncultured Caudovirales phage]
MTSILICVALMLLGSMLTLLVLWLMLKYLEQK